MKIPEPAASVGRCGPGTGFPTRLTPVSCVPWENPPDWPRRPGVAAVEMMDLRPVRRHITGRREPVRVCDGQPAGGDDVPIGDREALWEARYEATLCPTCQQRSGIPPFALRPQLYSSKPRRTIAELYTVPVLCDFDDIRNCPHCRLHPGDRSCRAWEEARKGVAVLHREARRIARDVAEVPEATAGRAAILHEFCDGSVGYLALEAPPWREAGEVTGRALEEALRVLEERGTPGRKAVGAARTPTGTPPGNNRGRWRRHEMGGGTPDRVGMG